MLDNLVVKKPQGPFPSQKVIVLAGGVSVERPVSLESGKGVFQALKTLGHQVKMVDFSQDLGQFVHDITFAFGKRKPEVVFNILHGKWGEDGIVQGVLEVLGIPYTSSGVLGSSLSMHKEMSRQVALTHGIPCPQGNVITVEDYICQGYATYPHVIKPLGEGSTMGVYYLEKPNPALLDMWPYGKEILVEDYIPGREIQVAVFDGYAMGAIEICFEGPLFSYQAKYVAGHARHITPPLMPPQAYKKVLHMAETMHQALKCRGITRSDFRYNDTHCQEGEVGELYYLETNPQPGMTALSLVPDIAAAQGWTYEDVIQWSLEDASCGR